MCASLGLTKLLFPSLGTVFRDTQLTHDTAIARRDLTAACESTCDACETQKSKIAEQHLKVIFLVVCTFDQFRLL